MDRAEFAKTVNDQVSEYIRFADAKAGAILTLVALVGGVVAATAPELLVLPEGGPDWLYWLRVALCLAVAICALVTVWQAAGALRPRVDAAGASLASFPDIAAMEREAYAQAIAALSDDLVTREFALHNSALARVAKSKFEHLASAATWLRASLIAAYLIAALYAVSKMAKP